ncbi:MAG: alpha/beta hydrolase [Rhodopirellula sp.]|nr:alpha/beta hydrolase [Rhodopirellula sp.]
MPLQNPVIVIPGITASELRNEYPVTPENVFSAVTTKDYEQIMLHPDDLRYERSEPARVRPNAVFSLPYQELILELRHNLASKADEPVPVYPFAYDWRQPLKATQVELANFVQEVIERTRLMRHYVKSGYLDNPKVDLVAHSMGGLVVAGFLNQAGKKSSVGKVVTLGTPFRGSYEAPVKVLTGTSSLGSQESGSREREAARATPALYHLLPSFDKAVVDTQGQPIDLFEVDAWQPEVIQTLAEFIRLNAVAPPSSQAKRIVVAKELFQSILNEAAEHRKQTDGLNLKQSGLNADSWLCIVGVNTETRVQLKRSGSGATRRFILSNSDRLDGFAVDSASRQTGDGTVPFLGARPAFLKDENLVCVRPKDLGYWEIGDRVLLGPVGFHGLLPKVNLVHRLVVAHLKGASGKGNDSLWACPAPGITAAKWRPPISGLQAKTS